MWTIGTISEVRRGEWCEDFYRTLIVWGVVAYNANGRRFGYIGPAEVGTQREAEDFADRVRNHARLVPAWTPVGNRHWGEMDPLYGSEEYESQGIESQWAMREKAEDPWFYEDAVRNSYMG